MAGKPSRDIFDLLDEKNFSSQGSPAVSQATAPGDVFDAIVPAPTVPGAAPGYGIPGAAPGTGISAPMPVEMGKAEFAKRELQRPIPAQFAPGIEKYEAPAMHPVQRGLFQGLHELAMGLTTPENVALIGGLTLAGPEIALGASIYFAGSMASQLPELYKAAKSAYEKGDAAEFTRILTLAGGTTVMAGAAGTHAMRGSMAMGRSMARSAAAAEGMAKVPKAEDLQRLPEMAAEATYHPEVLGLPRQEPVVLGPEGRPTTSPILGAGERIGDVFDLAGRQAVEKLPRVPFRRAIGRIIADERGELDIAVTRANKTDRSWHKGFAERARVPKYVPELTPLGGTVLDFGAGKAATHARNLREQGLDVTAYEFGDNRVEGVHDPKALDRQYDTVYASNVLNVQGSREMMASTLEQIYSATKDGGKAVVNFPKEPRYSDITDAELRGSLKLKFGSEPVQVERGVYVVQKGAPDPVKVAESLRETALSDHGLAVGKGATLNAASLVESFKRLASEESGYMNADTFIGNWVEKFAKDKRIAGVFSPEGIRDIVRGMKNTAAIFGEKYPDLDLTKQPKRSNSDNLFKLTGTYDVSTVCPRQDVYLATIRELERRRGALFSPEDRNKIALMMHEAGETPQCFFCYGGTARDKAEFAFEKVTDIWNRTASLYRKNPRPTTNQLNVAFDTWTAIQPDGRVSKLLKLIKANHKNPLARKLLKDPVRLRDIAHGDVKPANPFEAKLAAAIKTVVYQNLKANMPKGASAYRDYLLRVKQAHIDKINKSAGLRLNSQTDFRLWHTLETAKWVTHASARGAMAHVYTRSPEMVELFAPTGMKMNISFEFAHDASGKIKRHPDTGAPMIDTMNTMPFEKILEFRDRFPNEVGSMLVAMTKEDVLEGMKQGWVDMMIPHHRGAEVKFIFEQRPWLQDFTDFQHEHWHTKKTGDPVKVKLSNGKTVEFAVGDPITREHHFNDHALYLELAKKAGFSPRFEQFSDLPGYMKMVRDVAREPSNQRPLDATKINWEKAAEYAQRWVDEGASMTERAHSPRLVEFLEGEIAAGRWPELPGREIKAVEAPFKASGLVEGYDFKKLDPWTEDTVQIGNRLPRKVKTVKGDATVLGALFSKDLGLKGWTALKGQRVAGIKDVALVARNFLRNPQYEVGHLIFVKGGKIIENEVRTLKDPTSTRVMEGATYLEMERNLARTLEKNGADEVYVVHNHPDGNPRPSTTDITSIQEMMGRIPKIKGEVIINHKKFAWIDRKSSADPQKADIRLFEEWWTEEKDPLLEGRRAEVWHPSLGEVAWAPEEIARHARRMRTPEKSVGLLWIDMVNRIRALEAIPVELFMDRPALESYFRERARIHGAQMVVPYYDGGDISVRDMMRTYVNEEVILDGVYKGSMGQTMQWVPERGTSPLKVKSGGHPVWAASRTAATQRLPMRLFSDVKEHGSKFEQFKERASGVAARALALADKYEITPEKVQAIIDQAGDIRATGTIQPRDIRPKFRRGGQPEAAQTRGFEFSRAGIEKASADLVSLIEAYRLLTKQAVAAADVKTAAKLREARKALEAQVKAWQVLRSSAGRALHAFNNAIPPEMFDTLRSIGFHTKLAASTATAREPAFTAIGRAIANKPLPGQTVPPGFSKQVGRAGRATLSAARLNLFSVTSFSLDFLGNLVAVGIRIPGIAARDVSGDWRFPATRGLVRGIGLFARQGQLTQELFGRFKATSSLYKPMSPVLLEHLDKTFGGEFLPEEFGAFTERKGWGPTTKLASSAVDYFVGSPTYLKGFFDTSTKKLMVLSTIAGRAYEHANRMKLSGAQGKALVDQWLADPPKEILDEAIQVGKATSFSRDLTRWEENYASNPLVQLAFDVFARWPLQFTRWFGEVLGIDTHFYKKVRDGKATRADVAEYVGKTATGWGGMLLVKEMLYDNVDFNSMEYVDPETKDRYRLSSREPIPSALAVIALMKGDIHKAVAAAQHTSFPMAKLAAGEAGGLLGQMVVQLKAAYENPTNEPRRLMKEIDNIVNRLIPGQAMLTAIKTAFDPILREGIGANLPGISQNLPAVINATTGEPLMPRQRFMGIEFRSLSGTPLPGAARIMNPAEKMLNEYGFTTRHPIRTPVAGFYPAEIPEEVRKEWEIEFGKQRQRYLANLVRLYQDGALQTKDYEKVRKMIQKADSMAAKVATTRVNMRHVGRPKVRLPRRMTPREKALPSFIWENRQ